MNLTAEELGCAAKRNGLFFPEHVLDQLVAAIDAGKHVILTGPPGTGKTTLAYLTAEVAQKAMLCTGYLPTTATTEWTTFETIGGFQPTSEGLIFRPGMFVDRSEEHTSELQSLMRISYAVFCLKKKKTYKNEES